MHTKRNVDKINNVLRSQEALLVFKNTYVYHIGVDKPWSKAIDEGEVWWLAVMPKMQP